MILVLLLSGYYQGLSSYYKFALLKLISAECKGRCLRSSWVAGNSKMGTLFSVGNSPLDK